MIRGIRERKVVYCSEAYYFVSSYRAMNTKINVHLVFLFSYMKEGKNHRIFYTNLSLMFKLMHFVKYPQNFTASTLFYSTVE